MRLECLLGEMGVECLENWIVDTVGGESGGELHSVDVLSDESVLMVGGGVEGGELEVPDVFDGGE